MRVELAGVRRSFGTRAAVDGIDLDVASGEFVVLLGPSGCGKTTLLRLVAGLEEPEAGTIRLDGATVAGNGAAVPPGERGLGIVFQSYALWPHMSVARNVGFPLEVRKLPRAEREARIERALAQVGLGTLDEMGARYPHQLSGGQRQRVAVARCLAMAPRLVLLDEPLANLDPNLRASVQREFRQMHRELGSTFLHVTHDQAEAFALADRIAVMEAGRILQFGTPREIFEEPRSAAVARFVGGGALVPADLLERTGPGRARVRIAGHAADLRCPEGARPGPATACLRRDDLDLHRRPAPGLIEARLTDLRYQGGAEVALARLPGGEDVEVTLPRGDPAPPPGSVVGLSVRDGWVVPP
jgi:iron(III) transport system ATP-binding protein